MQFSWILLLFQTIYVHCPRENKYSKSLRVALINTFGYNFIRVPKVGRVIFWKISNEKKTFRPQEYVKYATKFDSHGTYLIFTQNREMSVSIYYWLGRNTLLDDKKTAAKYAILQYTLFMKYMDTRIYWSGDVSINREVEDMESESFHDTINYVEREFYHTYVDTRYISQYPNLYVVRGDNTTRIKKVPVGTLWLMNDTCLILESGCTIEELTPVNMYCGSNVSEKAKKRAKVFVDFIYMLFIRFDPTEPPPIFDNTNRNEAKFKLLIEVLEDKRNYNSYEIDESNDHLKDAATFVSDRDKGVKLYWIKHHTIEVEATNEKKDIFEIHEDKTRPLFTQHYQCGSETGIGFLFDSASIAGLIVHIHHDSNVKERIKIISIMEDYIEQKYSSSSISPRVRIIREEHLGCFILDFLINMITWPLSDDELGAELVHW